MMVYKNTLSSPVRNGSSFKRGFTLVELLVVLAILGLLASIATPKVMKHLGRAKTQTVRMELKNIAASLDVFRLDVGRYPTQEEGLMALIERPTLLEGWNGPYLDKKEKFQDPWGGIYIYKIPGENGDYDLMTLGADKAVGGVDDAQDILQ